MGPPRILHDRAKIKRLAGVSARLEGPRGRYCLLKGCAQKFHPRRRHQRYCSESCREEARKWSRWKAQQRYRETAVGQQKRNGQSRRYRERVKSRKPPEPEAVNEAARVITKEPFFRGHVRPAEVLRAVRAAAAKYFAALLFARMPARAGASQLGHTLDVNQNVYTQSSVEIRQAAVNQLEKSLQVM